MSVGYHVPVFASLQWVFRDVNIWNSLIVSCANVLFPELVTIWNSSINYSKHCVSSYNDQLSLLVCSCAGVVSSKTACFLSPAEVAHISHCLVKGFIYSFPVVSEETQVPVSRDCQQQRPSAAAGNLRQPRTVGRQKLLSSCELQVVSQSCDCDIAPSASCQSSSDRTGWLEIEDINIITVPVILVNEFFLFITVWWCSLYRFMCQRIYYFLSDFVYSWLLNKS